MGSPNLILFIAGAVLVIMLGVVALVKRFALSGAKKLPYGKIHILSDAEKDFFHTLTEAFVNDEIVIETKVRLADIVAVRRISKKNYQKYYQRIAQDEVDFIILDKKNLEPVFAVELKNPRGRSSADRQRETFHKALFQQIDIPYFIFSLEQKPTSAEVRQRVLEGLGVKTKTSST